MDGSSGIIAQVMESSSGTSGSTFTTHGGGHRRFLVGLGGLSRRAGDEIRPPKNGLNGYNPITLILNTPIAWFQWCGNSLHPPWFRGCLIWTGEGINMLIIYTMLTFKLDFLLDRLDLTYQIDIYWLYIVDNHWLFMDWGVFCRAFVMFGERDYYNMLG